VRFSSFLPFPCFEAGSVRSKPRRSPFPYRQSLPYRHRATSSWGLRSCFSFPPCAGIFSNFNLFPVFFFFFFFCARLSLYASPSAPPVWGLSVSSFFAEIEGILLPLSLYFFFLSISGVLYSRDPAELFPPLLAGGFFFSSDASFSSEHEVTSFWVLYDHPPILSLRRPLRRPQPTLFFLPFPSR